MGDGESSFGQQAGGEEGYSEQQSGGYGQGQPTSNDYSGQLQETRAGVSALYNAVNALSQKMGSYDQMHERLSPLLNPPSPPGPQFDDYDATLATLQQQVDALSQLFETDQNVRARSYQEFQQQREQEHMQQLGGWVDTVENTIDEHLEAAGYPDFKQNAGMVKSHIMSEYQDAQRQFHPDSIQMRICTHLANNPQYWADVYSGTILPSLRQQMNRFDRLAERREVSRYVPPAQTEYHGRWNFS